MHFFIQLLRGCKCKFLERTSQRHRQDAASAQAFWFFRTAWIAQGLLLHFNTPCAFISCGSGVKLASSRLSGSSSGQNNWRLGGSVMLNLGLRGMETIIPPPKKGDTLTNATKQFAVWSSGKKKISKRKNLDPSLRSTRYFIQGFGSARTPHRKLSRLWLCQNLTQKVKQKHEEPPSFIPLEQLMYFKAYLARMSGECQNHLLTVISEIIGVVV